MTGDEVDMEVDDLSSLKGVKTRFVILVLVPPAGIGVTLVIGVGNFNSVLDRTGEIYPKNGD
jgi:hypothetical protein